MEDYIAQFLNAGLVIALVFLILKRQDKRIDDLAKILGDFVKKLEGQPSREYCNLQHASVENKLHEGDKKFEKFEAKIDSMKDTLAIVNTNVALLVADHKKEDKS
jgi:hypothetical protein